MRHHDIDCIDGTRRNEQHANGFELEDRPASKRPPSAAPVVKPIRINAPNSVFALGGITTK